MFLQEQKPITVLFMHMFNTSFFLQTYIVISYLFQHFSKVQPWFLDVKLQPIPKMFVLF